MSGMKAVNFKLMHRQFCVFDGDVITELFMKLSKCQKMESSQRFSAAELSATSADR